MNNIKSPEGLMSFLEERLKYGYVADGKTFTEPLVDGEMDRYYKLRLGEDLIRAGYGVCWDVVEYERIFFENKKIEHECYLIQAFKTRAEGGPTHTFLLFEENNLWKWFEYTWAQYRGIHEYKTKEEALNDICNKHLQYAELEQRDIRLYKYYKITKPLNPFEFIEHCYTGEKLPLDIKSDNRRLYAAYKK